MAQPTLPFITILDYIRIKYDVKINQLFIFSARNETQINEWDEAQ